MLAKDIVVLVPMPRLLSELGFKVDTRTRRSICFLHGGKTFGAFSWRDDGLWCCHSCGRGGDKLDLVREVRHCDFKDALKFLATLAGVNLDGSRKFRDELARARRERKKREVEEARLKAIERSAFLESRDDVLELEALRRHAGRRLAALEWDFDGERFVGEREVGWWVLEIVAKEMPQAAAVYAVAAFSNSQTRARFATHPEERAALVDRCLEVGGIYDDRGKFRGLTL